MLPEKLFDRKEIGGKVRDRGFQSFESRGKLEGV